MKTMSCNSLAANGVVFSTDTLKQIAEPGRKQGMKMFENEGKARFAAMYKLQELMQRPDTIGTRNESRNLQYGALPDE